MTTFRLWSDLHLETGNWHTEWFDGAEGQYLILAGDIDEIKKHKREIEFFKLCNDSFIKTFYVPGNHEFWGTYVEKWADAKAFFAEQGLENIILMQQDTYELDDVTIFGATMWYDATHLNTSMPRAYLKQEAKDFQYIATMRRQTWSGLRPIDVIYWNVTHIRWLQTVVPLCEKKKVVITHHAPSPASMDPTFDDDHAEYINHIDLKTIPADVWVHGHVHYSHRYIQDDVEVISNPRGYQLYNAVNSNFDPQFTFEV